MKNHSIIPPPVQGAGSAGVHTNGNGKAALIVEQIEAACKSGWDDNRRWEGDGDGDGEPEPIGPQEADDDPHRLARIYRRDRCVRFDGLTLRYWRGDWHRWSEDEMAYRPVSVAELKAEVTEAIKTEFDILNVKAVESFRSRRAGMPAKDEPPPKAHKVTTGLVGNVLQALGGMTLLAGTVDAPAWLVSDLTLPPADEILPAGNLLVHLPRFVANRDDAILPPTPRFFNSWALDYDFDPAAPEPRRWLEFLGQLWPDDPEAIATLQDWFGYCLTADTRQQKILALIGPKRSGKGTIARVVKALIGARNVAGPTLSSLATNFGLAPLIGKPLAIIDDARLSGRTDTAVITERLLTISGEGTLDIDRKHRDAWTGQLPTRIMLVTNELPRLTDSSGALAGRLILLRFARSFYGQEDPDLTNKLLAELPGILLWAIGGWCRLKERGRFIQPTSGRELIEDMENLSSPVGAFIQDRCLVEPGREILAADLYAAWRSWCAEKGRDNPGTEQSFGRDLRAVLPALTTPYRRLDDGTRKRSYAGIGLLGDAHF